MRDIKFRAWDKDTKEFDYWELKPGKEAWVHSGHEQPQQYTGLKDKNGTEIYEGDIFESPDMWDEDTGFPSHKPNGKMLRGFIDWGDYGDASCHMSYGWFMNTQESQEKYGWQTPSIQDVTKLEVIGNIYENKDLLK